MNLVVTLFKDIIQTLPYLGQVMGQNAVLQRGKDVYRKDETHIGLGKRRRPDVGKRSQDRKNNCLLHAGSYNNRRIKASEFGDPIPKKRCQMNDNCKRWDCC